MKKAVLRARIDGLLERRTLSTKLYRKQRQSEERFQALFETAPDPVFVLDSGARVRAANDAFRRLTGLATTDVVGRHVSELPPFGDDAASKLSTDLDTSGVDGSENTYTVTYRAEDGERRYAEANTAPAPGGEETELVAVWRDVTERRTQREELKRQNERLDEFASMLAHELRNPLAIAQMYLSMLDGVDGNESLQQVDEALGRMDRMTDALLNLARQGDSVGETEAAPLARVVEDSWSEVVAPEADLRVSVTGRVRADADRLQEVFVNLFRNAVENGGPAVTVAVGNVDDSGIYVENDGPGIPREKRDVIFERGYSAAEGGVGIGLTIVKRIVEAHGWTITVTASADGGARFEITQMDSLE